MKRINIYVLNIIVYNNIYNNIQYIITYILYISTFLPWATSAYYQLMSWMETFESMYIQYIGTMELKTVLPAMLFRVHVCTHTCSETAPIRDLWTLAIVSLELDWAEYTTLTQSCA